MFIAALPHLLLLLLLLLSPNLINVLAAHAACRFRTANQLWKQPETTLAATTNCYAYARGPDAVIVTTNAGSGLTTTCNVQLPKDSRLMEAGPSGVLDVLPLPGVRGSASSQVRHEAR